MSILCHTHSDRFHYVRVEGNYKVDKDLLSRSAGFGRDLFVAPTFTIAAPVIAVKNAVDRARIKWNKAEVKRVV